MFSHLLLYRTFSLFASFGSLFWVHIAFGCFNFYFWRCCFVNSLHSKPKYEFLKEFSWFIFSYPEPKHYDEISTAILKRFPSLVSESCSYSDAHGLWYSRVKSYFKNHRFRHKHYIPEIIETKKIYGKRKLDQDVENEIFVKKACFGVKNLLPVLPEGEDAFTWDRYQSELKEQSSLAKDRRNSELTKRLMDKTFLYRRHVIIKEVIRLRTCLTSFHWYIQRSRYTFSFTFFVRFVENIVIVSRLWCNSYIWHLQSFLQILHRISD